MPGFTIFTRMLCGAKSFARHCAKLILAALLALYGGSVWDPIWPATDARKIMVPARRSIIPGAMACATLTIPMTFTSSTLGQSPGLRLVKGNPNLPDPIAAAGGAVSRHVRVVELRVLGVELEHGLDPALVEGRDHALEDLDVVAQGIPFPPLAALCGALRLLPPCGF